jgi:hypothetical protein
MDHKPKLLDLVRQTIRLKHYSMRTERAYVDWIKRFMLFHDKRHPASMGAPEVHAFLSHPAVEQQVAASTNGKRSAPSCCCTAKFSIGRLAS